MGSKSKNKGKSWERDFATFLSELYNESFIRVPHSGAYIGGKNSIRKEFLHEGQIRAMKGDIIPPSDWKHFNVECKSYAEFPFHQLFTEGKIGLLESWIEQAMDAADEGDLNLIIMKFNRKGKFVAVQHKYNWNLSCNHFTYNSVNFGTWLIFDLDEFFKYNSTQVKSFSSSKQLLTEAQH